MRELPLLLFALLGAVALHAQEVNPATKPGQVQITFLPPPMEGTCSLGIYNKAGKLVRTLKREALPDKDFIVGLNGLITTWDGKDDSGAAAKPGVYSVRGYMVHSVELSGEAFHCNDWIAADEAPHPREITKLTVLPNERLLADVKLADGQAAQLESGLDGAVKLYKGEAAPGEPAKAEPEAKGPSTIRDGRLVPAGDSAPLPDLHQPVHSSPGRDGTLWVIDRAPDGVEVQQYSAKGEFLRRLAIAAGEPVPEKIAASAKSDLIFLLEKSEGVQRVRGLALEQLKNPLPASDPAVEGALKSSTWRIVFSKTIRGCQDFAAAAPFLGRTELPKPEQTTPVKLSKNPLGKKGDASLDASVVCEASGSFLQTADGLTLCRLTDTENLKWAVFVRTDKALFLFQSDGAVVEEYKLGKLTSMMAFDAGEYELK